MLWHVFEWGDQCYGTFSNGGTNVMACFRMGRPMLWHVFEWGPMLWHVFEWGHQCYGMFSNGGTNVMACFRMGGPMLWHVFEWGDNIGGGGPFENRLGNVGAIRKHNIALVPPFENMPYHWSGHSKTCHNIGGVRSKIGLRTGGSHSKNPIGFKFIMKERV